MERKIKQQVRGYRTQDGAGVNFVRVLGNGTVQEYDPILKFDSFDSINPDDYTAGFGILHEENYLHPRECSVYGFGLIFLQRTKWFCRLTIVSKMQKLKKLIWKMSS